MRLLLTTCAFLMVFLNQPNAQCISQAQLMEDLDYLQFGLETKHPNPYWRNPKSEFNQLKKRILREYKNQGCAWVYANVLRLLALTEDGHNDAYAPEAWTNVNKVYPIKFSLFGNQLFVIAASAEYQNLLGAEVTHIGNVETQKVIRKIKSVIPGDNTFGKREIFEDYIRMPAMHFALGLSSDISSGSIRVHSSGNIRTVNLSDPGPRTKPIEVGPPRRGIPDDWKGVNTSTTKPLWQKNLHRNYWFEHLEDSKTIYFQFNRTRNERNESLATFSSRLFETITNTNTERLIIDLRWNRGGDATLTQPILHGIIRATKLLYPGGIYILTSNYTFSAAITLSSWIEQNTHAIFVGEPTGAGPNYNAEAISFKLPNSEIEIDVSRYFWANSDARDTRQWIQPDIPAPFSIDDYTSGDDPALRVINDIKIESIERNFSNSPIYNWNRPNQRQARSSNQR